MLEGEGEVATGQQRMQNDTQAEDDEDECEENHGNDAERDER
jgi:hypothetical protein